MKRRPPALLLLAGLAIGCTLAGSAIAQTASEHADHHPAADPAAASDLSDGEVRKVDKDAGKVTLKHGAIKNLDMPPMTMVFQVKDKALLNSVQSGDTVRFKAETENGKFFVTDIRTVK
jgi:Cu/Ag efflux protein CusF